MSEKDKMQATELAKIMDNAKLLGERATSFMDGYVKGYIDKSKEAKTENPDKEEGGAA